MTKILVIDDDGAIRQLLKLILENEGFQVFEAEDGVEGLRVLENEVVDLVITDVLMPEKDGLAVIKELQKTHPTMRVIALSGGGMTLSAETSLFVARRMGAFESLAKPFTKDEVLHLVNKVLANGSSAG
ncbi:MAG: response regulator [Magnetococcales bacterium]|nr:response regulator [Magnetococcales bacterium]NGZ29426.1 response regulator [Magnetococcales bacterium]